MDFRFTIGRKIGTGFGLLLLLIVLVFYSTNKTLNESRAINRKIEQIYSPSVDALEKLKLKIVRSRMLITQWGLVQSRSDNPGKLELKRIKKEEWPELRSQLDSLSQFWKKEKEKKGEYTETKREMLKEVFEKIEGLFEIQGKLEKQLPDFQSYNDPTKMLLIKPLVVNGGDVHVQTKNILSKLNELIKREEATKKEVRTSMNRSFDLLQFLMRYLGLFLGVGGILIAYFTVRSIVRPIYKLKEIILNLCRGIFPEQKMKPTNDEIGEMSVALNQLVDGLKRTTDFSKQVGMGNFYAYDYKPLSDEDTLGHALLKMRDELAENERKLEEKVAQRTREVVEQKEEVERQRQRVEGLYKDLTDSIKYAQRLQESILPSEEWVQERYPDYFILFKPKDIVSGDFYWFDEAQGIQLFAAVDCTGHGVPGAFMSLVGHNGLDQAVKEHGVTDPGKILDDLNKSASETLNKTTDGESVSDGMDIALCALDLDNKKLKFAGANNPLYLIRNGELYQYRADKVAIGALEVGEHHYHTHEIDLQENDHIYIFSDGFPDQFGGEKGKKFKYKPFKKLLQKIHDQPMKEQRDTLDQTIEDWRGDLEQIDDILVIGVSI